MEKIILKALARTKEQSVKDMRRNATVPGIVYGNVDTNVMIAMDEVELKKIYIKAGESTLVEIEADGKKIPVLFHAVDFDPVSDRMIHVDFYAVNMKEEVEADVHIRFEGESPAVKDMSAILVTALHEVTVKALPANLPHDLAVDLGKLTEFDSTITVADIKVPDGVTIINDLDEVIAIAQEPREEKVEEPVIAEGAEGAAAAGAEGAAPAEGDAAKEGEKKE